MNSEDHQGPESLHSYIEPELEARLTAMVLGESSDFEREELERLIEDRPELAVLHRRLSAIHGLLREVGQGEAQKPEEEWRLSTERREALLALFEGGETRSSESAEESGSGNSQPQVDEAAGREVPVAVPIAAKTVIEVSFWERVKPMAKVAAMVVGAALLVSLFFPRLARMKSANEDGRPLTLASSRQPSRMDGLTEFSAAQSSSLNYDWYTPIDTGATGGTESSSFDLESKKELEGIREQLSQNMNRFFDDDEAFEMSSVTDSKIRGRQKDSGVVDESGRQIGAGGVSSERGFSGYAYWDSEAAELAAADEPDAFAKGLSRTRLYRSEIRDKASKLVSELSAPESPLGLSASDGDGEMPGQGKGDESEVSREFLAVTEYEVPEIPEEFGTQAPFGAMAESTGGGGFPVTPASPSINTEEKEIHITSKFVEVSGKEAEALTDWFEESLDADRGGARVTAALDHDGDGEPIETFKRESRRRAVPLVAGIAGSSETVTRHDVDANGIVDEVALMDSGRERAVREQLVEQESQSSQSEGEDAEQEMSRLYAIVPPELEDRQEALKDVAKSQESERAAGDLSEEFRSKAPVRYVAEPSHSKSMVSVDGAAERDGLDATINDQRLVRDWVTQAEGLEELGADVDNSSGEGEAAPSEADFMLFKSRQLMELGDLDEAESLARDAQSNTVSQREAGKQLALIEKQRGQYFDAARDHTRSKFRSEIESAWELKPMSSGDIDAKTDSLAAIVVPETDEEAKEGSESEVVQWSSGSVSAGGIVSGVVRNEEALRTSGSGSLDAISEWSGVETATGIVQPQDQGQSNRNLKRDEMDGIVALTPDVTMLGRKPGNEDSTVSFEWRDEALAGEPVRLDYGVPVRTVSESQAQNGRFNFTIGDDFDGEGESDEAPDEAEQKAEESQMLASYVTDLNLEPEVVEFDGFINYGSEITSSWTKDESGRESLQEDEEAAKLPALLRADDGANDLHWAFVDADKAAPPQGLDDEAMSGPITPRFGDLDFSAYGENLLSRSGSAQPAEGRTEFSPAFGPVEAPVSFSNGDRPALRFETDDAVFISRWRPIQEDLRRDLPSNLEEALAEEEAFSTFSLHVSDVSFQLAQAALAQGEWPDPARIRIEEFVNAFDYGDPMPNQEEKVSCRMEQAIHPFLQQRNLVRIAMRTAEAGRSASTPLRLTLLLDNSGSMERVDRQETVRRAFATLAGMLQPEDQITLISFARQPRLIADAVSGNEAGQLVEAVTQLPSEGGTNLEAALNLAFEKAREHAVDGAQNRVVLLTDGAANLGNAKPESLSAMIEAMRNAGVAFDAAGIGAEGLNDEILEALTRKGDGRYYLLDRPEDAAEGFSRQIAGALRPAAQNVKIQVEFNPKRVGRYKLLGFEKHRLEKEDFRDDSVDAAEMAAAEAGVAVYQVEPMADGEGDVGSVSVRFRDLDSGQMIEKRWPIPFEAQAARPDQAASSMQMATIASQLAARLKGGPLGDVVDLAELSRLAAELPASDQQSERVSQLRAMIEQARQLEEQ